MDSITEETIIKPTSYDWEVIFLVTIPLFCLCTLIALGELDIPFKYILDIPSKGMLDIPFKGMLDIPFK